MECIAGWADVNPRAMSRLLQDPGLQLLLLDAMRSFDCFEPKSESSPSGRRSRSS